jgi:N-acetylmuramoyl-L-alanine amidase
MSDIERIVAAHPRATRPISEIVVHCTATPEGRDVSVETIRGWHKGQGWRDIGYHWVVLLDGSVKLGRPEAQVGSHVAGRNTGTLGVVYVGGVAKDAKTPKDTRTPAQRDALMGLCRSLIDKYPTIKKVNRPPRKRERAAWQRPRQAARRLAQIPARRCREVRHGRYADEGRDQGTCRHRQAGRPAR